MPAASRWFRARAQPIDPAMLFELVAILYGGFILGFLLFAVVSAWYRAQMMNHFAAHTSFEERAVPRQRHGPQPDLAGAHQHADGDLHARPARAGGAGALGALFRRAAAGSTAAPRSPRSCNARRTPEPAAKVWHRRSTSMHSDPDDDVSTAATATARRRNPCRPTCG